MKKRSIIFIGLLLSLVPGLFAFYDYNKEPTIYFFHISDPQFGFLEANKSIEKEVTLYEKAVANINRIEPDFVVITGDFVHDNKDSLQWAEFNRITGMIKSSIPVYLVPGNHEYSQSPTEKEFADYKKTYGDDKFSVIDDRNLFIGLNSSLINSEFHTLENEQFKWLENELMKAKNIRNVFVFTHHPFFVKNPEEPDNYSNIVLENRRKYLDLFNKHNVNAVFSGHLHRNSYVQYKGIDMISTSAVGKQLGDDLSGLRVIKITKDNISNNYYSLMDLEEIELEK